LRLGGFVIHGNAAGELDRCLASLGAVADELVAVDSGSTDGSASIAAARGARRVELPWRGYGAARAAAAAALAHCDYVLFLDSDEWLLPDAIEALRAWRQSDPTAPYYLLRRRDWAELPGHRFLFGEERHVRIYRRGAATWSPRQIVHEALPRTGAVETAIRIEHRFATSPEAFLAKEARYALLWAVQANAEGRRPKWPPAQRLVHSLRLGIARGGALRGGLDGWRLAWGFGGYHALKHRQLRALRGGARPDVVRAYAEGRLADLHRLLA
jgi:(heptosyl)LPS beta-1,4-glucosyltransferase